MTAAFAQSEGVAIFNNKKDVDNKNGIYVFQFSEDGVDDDHILQQMAHYAEYFQMEYETEDGLRTFKVELTDVNDEYKKIMHRLFISMKLEKVSYKNKMYSTKEFVDTVIL